MATLIELGPDDVLLMRIDHEPEECDLELVASVRAVLGIRAVLVLRTGAEISSLPVDEVLRALAGS